MFTFDTFEHLSCLYIAQNIDGIIAEFISIQTIPLTFFYSHKRANVIIQKVK